MGCRSRDTGHLQPPPGTFAVRTFSNRAKEEGVRGARQRRNHGNGHRGVGGPPSAPGWSARPPRSARLCFTSKSLPRRSQGQSPSLCSVRACGPRAVVTLWGKHRGERGDESAGWGAGGGGADVSRRGRSGPAASAGWVTSQPRGGLRGCTRAGRRLPSRDGCSKHSPEVFSIS